MRFCAIYSDGPKLRDSFIGGYDIGICINKAANKIPRQLWNWLCAGDLIEHQDLFAEIRTPITGYCCMPSQKTKLDSFRNKSVLTWDTIGVPEGTQWSITASFYLAKWLNSDCIHVYGHNQRLRGKRYTKNRKISENAEIKTALENINLPVRFY